MIGLVLLIIGAVLMVVSLILRRRVPADLIVVGLFLYVVGSLTFVEFRAYNSCFDNVSSLDDDYKEAVVLLERDILYARDSIDISSTAPVTEQIVDKVNEQRSDYDKLYINNNCNDNTWCLNYSDPLFVENSNNLEAYYIPTYIYITFTDLGDSIEVYCSSPITSKLSFEAKQLIETANVSIEAYSFRIPL